MGREEDRNRFARQQMHQSVNRGLHGTQTPPMDRFGVRLKLGDLVLYTPTYPTLFQVSEIVPVLDPTAPAGTVQLVLSGVMPLVLDPHKPCISVVHVESPEGAEQAIKRHHAGRAVSEGNGGGSGIEVVDGAPGDVHALRVTRPDGHEGGSQGDAEGDGPTADAEGGGSAPEPGPGNVSEPQDPGQGDRQSEDRRQGEPRGDATGRVGSAASGVGASESEDQRHLEQADLDHLDSTKGSE